jgi:hypothetical protein
MLPHGYALLLQPSEKCIATARALRTGGIFCHGVRKLQAVRAEAVVSFDQNIYIGTNRIAPWQ